jgi:hypothetical protein
LFFCLPWFQRREPPQQRQHWFLEKASREVRERKREKEKRERKREKRRESAKRALKEP